jgi:hypothetical protein
MFGKSAPTAYYMQLERPADHVYWVHVYYHPVDPPPHPLGIHATRTAKLRL